MLGVMLECVPCNTVEPFKLNEKKNSIFIRNGQWAYVYCNLYFLEYYHMQNVLHTALRLFIGKICPSANMYTNCCDGQMGQSLNI